MTIALPVRASLKVLAGRVAVASAGMMRSALTAPAKVAATMLG
tara:strand:+ start:2120 stop:2248 length:129 start_codon:yes stop_codon:yes gene_type:complete